VTAAHRVRLDLGLRIAASVGLLAMVGLYIYASQLATNPYLYIPPLLAWTGVLIWAIAQRMAASIVLAPGQLLVMTSGLVDAIAKAHGWPTSQQHQIAVLGNWLLLPLTASLVVAIAILVRSELLARRRSVRG
jgi:hypothetical protein